jgi:hypothetical protein
MTYQRLAGLVLLAPVAAQVKADWEKFFNAKTPAAERAKLLTKVQVTGPGQAKVTYTILISGQPALRSQTGTAVRQDGTWKVGATSFCSLLTLGNGGITTGHPAGCHVGTS